MVPLWVGLREDLAGSLSEVDDLRLERMHLLLVLHRVPIHRVLIGQVEELVETNDRLLPFLLVPEHQVHPAVDALTHPSLLERPLQLANVQVRVFPGPFWQLNIVDSSFALHYPQVQLVYVQVHLRQAVQLRQQLPDV